MIRLVISNTFVDIDTRSFDLFVNNEWTSTGFFDTLETYPINDKKIRVEFFTDGVFTNAVFVNYIDYE